VDAAGIEAYVKAAARFPGILSAFSTSMAFAPASPAGVTAVITVSDTTEKLATGRPPILTEVVVLKPVPEIVIAVPPAVEPLVGLTLPITGADKNLRVTDPALPAEPDPKLLPPDPPTPAPTVAGPTT
jgi:hypothetical protein